MFGINRAKKQIEKEVEVLENYLKMNDALYSDRSFKEEYDEFNKKLHELNVNYLANIPGYEQYDDQYVYQKQIEFMTDLFKQYPGLDLWNRGLCVYLNSNRSYIKNAGLIIGDRVLSPEAIIMNENKARQRLAQLKALLLAEETYKTR